MSICFTRICLIAEDDTAAEELCRILDVLFNKDLVLILELSSLNIMACTVIAGE